MASDVLLSDYLYEEVEMFLEVTADNAALPPAMRKRAGSLLERLRRDVAPEYYAGMPIDPDER